MTDIELVQEKVKILARDIPSSNDLLINQETPSNKRKGSIGESLRESGKTPNKRE